MPRLSMNEITTFRWSFEEDVARYHAAGITAIGVWRQKLSDYGEEKGALLLAETGMAVSNLLWAGGFTGSDGRTYRDSVDDAADALRLAAALSAPCLIVYSGARAGHTHNHARRLLCGALKELAPLAGDLGVTLAVEPMHPGCADQWTFLTQLDEALALISAVESPHVRLAFDTYHLGHDPGVVQQIPQIIDRIAIVHLGDSRVAPQGEQNRCLLGEGAVPLADLVEALASSGYDGDYDVELVGEEIEATDYEELLAKSQAAFEQLVA